MKSARVVLWIIGSLAFLAAIAALGFFATWGDT